MRLDADQIATIRALAAQGQVSNGFLRSVYRINQRQLDDVLNPKAPPRWTPDAEQCAENEARRAEVAKAQGLHGDHVSRDQQFYTLLMAQGGLPRIDFERRALVGHDGAPWQEPAR